MPPEYVRDDAVGRVGRASNCSSSSSARAVDLAAGEVRELADQREVLAAGEVLVDRGVLAGEADAAPAPAAGPSRTSTPSTRAVPPSGRSSVVSMRTTVVLPAPLGPSRPSTVPSGTSNETPFTASTSPKHFTRSSATIAGSATDRHPSAISLSVDQVLMTVQCSTFINCFPRLSVVSTQAARDAWASMHALFMEGEAHDRVHRICAELGLSPPLLKAFVHLGAIADGEAVCA